VVLFVELRSWAGECPPEESEERTTWRGYVSRGSHRRTSEEGQWDVNGAAVKRKG